MESSMAACVPGISAVCSKSGKEQNMGLIKAAAGAVGGMMADQWRSFFVCDAIDDDVLVVKGSKQASGRSSNTKVNQTLSPTGQPFPLLTDNV